MKRLELNVSKRYDVLIGKGLLSSEKCGLEKILKGEKACIITDNTVDILYSNMLKQTLENLGLKVFKTVIKAGEDSKNFENLYKILEELAQNGFRRDDIICGLGGGVVGDIAGFAAAVYLRGIKYAAFPTTFLAMVDSSVGGKTAVNLSSGKNMAGTFYQPDIVICDTDVLDTLPIEIFNSGAAEVIKYGMIADETLFCKLEKEGFCDVENIIEKSLLTKAGFIDGDERDNGKRKILNFGHTIGHSIEKESDYKVSHGQAVAIGMAVITRAFDRRGEMQTRLEKLLLKSGLPVECDILPYNLYKSAIYDKKSGKNGISLVIPEKIGKCVLKDVTFEELGDIIKAGMVNGHKN